jgi:hypothetical protein
VTHPLFFISLIGGDLLGRRGPAVRLGRFRLGPRVWSGSAIRPATPHASAASWPFPFSLCRHPHSAGSWHDPSGPTPRAETASLGCAEHMHRFRALSPRSRVVCHELSQFGRQVGFSAPAAHVVRKSRIFWRISRAGTFYRRRAAETLSIRCRQPEQSVAAKPRTPFRRERDGAAGFRTVPVVFPRDYAFATHSRLRGCAGRCYPSHSTSQDL